MHYLPGTVARKENVTRMIRDLVEKHHVPLASVCNALDAPIGNVQTWLRGYATPTLSLYESKVIRLYEAHGKTVTPMPPAIPQAMPAPKPIQVPLAGAAPIPNPKQTNALRVSGLALYRGDELVSLFSKKEDLDFVVEAYNFAQKAPKNWATTA